MCTHKNKAREFFSVILVTTDEILHFQLKTRYTLYTSHGDSFLANAVQMTDFIPAAVIDQDVTTPRLPSAIKRFAVIRYSDGDVTE